VRGSSDLDLCQGLRHDAGMQELGPPPIVLGVVAVLLALVRARNLFAVGLSAPMFNAVVLKLLAARHVDKILKLCDAVPRAAYSRLVRAMVVAAQECRSSDSRILVNDTIRSAHAQTSDRELARLKWGGWLSALSFALACTASGIAISTRGFSLLAAAPTLLVSVFWLIALVQVARFKRTSAEALDKLLPALGDYVEST
jgi:hypothetical protein